MGKKRREALDLPKQVGLPQEELDLLNKEETTIGEDIKNMGKGMGEAFDVGGFSGAAKTSAIKSTYYKHQSENWLLPKEEREYSFEKSVEYREQEIKRKEGWAESKEQVQKTLGEIRRPAVKFLASMGTGVISDYSDVYSLNRALSLEFAMQYLSAGTGKIVDVGVSRLKSLVTNMLVDGVEEGALNAETQMFMLENPDIDYSEAALSTLYGFVGSSVFPMLGSAAGMAKGTFKGKIGKETFEEISNKVIKEYADKAKTDLIKSKVENKRRYINGNYDRNIVIDVSKIESNIDNMGTLTGNLREQGDSIVTVNGKPLSEMRDTGKLIKEWKGDVEGRTLEQEKEILDNIEKELQRITGSRTLAEGDIILDQMEKELIEMRTKKDIVVDDIETELKISETGVERQSQKYGTKFGLEVFGKDNIYDKEIAKLFEGKKQITHEELKMSTQRSKDQMELDIIKDEDIAVNDIGVDNDKAAREILESKPLGAERKFSPDTGKYAKPSKFMEEIEKEELTFKIKTEKVTKSVDSITDVGELKDVDIVEVNEFIEDYGLEETIPLLKTKVDGTIDFGNKTKEEFVNDFKVELQLFSDPIDKSTQEAVFKNITLRAATKVVNESKDILGTLFKKSKEKLGRPLELKERDTLIKNFIKEKLYISYKYSENRHFTNLHPNTSLEVDGNRLGAKEIFNLMETDGDKGFLAKAIFDGKLETKTKGAGLSMRKFIKRFDDSIRLLVEGNYKTDFDNIHNSVMFDSNKLYYDSVDEAGMIRITNKEGELDLSKLSSEEKAELDVFAFDVFKNKNSDLFDEKTAKLVWDNFTMHGKAPSELEGTALHQLGELQAFFDEKLIDKATLRKLTERYHVSDRVLYNRMVKASSNANALYNTFGYKPKATMDRIFGNYSKSNPLVKKSMWLYGEGKQAWTLKTKTNDYANMIFADEIGRTKGQMPFKGQWYFKYKAKVDSILLGITDLPSEVGLHVAKRTVVGRESFHKIVYQTVKSVVQMHTLTKKISEGAESTFLRENVGALGSLYEFMITKGDTDYSGAIADRLATMTPKQKAIFVADQYISKANSIRQVDLYGDKLALFGTSYDFDKFSKVGYKEIMSKSKYNYLASKLDQFGISEGTFNLMVNAKRGDLGIRDYAQYTKKELEIFGGTASVEIRKMEDFTSFYSSKIGFTKPDIEFAKAKNLFRTDDDKFLTALQMYWKKTMYTKLKDGKELLTTMNTYGGLGKTFDFVNMDHYVRLMLGSIAIGIGGYGSDRMDKLIFGYESEEIDTLTEYIMFVFNQFGMYTLTDQASLMRLWGQVLNGKTIETKAKAAAKLFLPNRPLRIGEQLIEAD